MAINSFHKTAVLVIALLIIIQPVYGNESYNDYRFIENKGQWHANVLYKSDIPSGALFLENNRFTYHFYDASLLKKLHDHDFEEGEDMDNLTMRHHAFRVGFPGSNPSPDISANERFSEYFNYFLRKDRVNWASKASAYGKVRYKELYNGVDMELYTSKGLLKYDFIVKPGADPILIEMEYEGVDDIYLKNGNLIIKTSLNEILEEKPYAFQIKNGEKEEVACHFQLENNQITFVFPEGYDNSLPLVIDPTLMFSTYSGSTANNFGYTATFDAEGFLYSGSSAFGTGYPTTVGAYNETFNGGTVDIAISKYDTTGTFMVYSTYIGGSNVELPHSLIVNNNNELFIYGTTSSLDYPVTSNAYDTSFSGGTAHDMTNGLGVNYTNGSDIIISRLSADGSALLASTYLGGSENDGLNTVGALRYNYADEIRGEIMVDNNNYVYITSCTQSADFPVTSGAFQPAFGGGAQDGCVVKLDNNLTQLAWSSFLGGENDDACYSIDLDDSSNVYVAGGTVSDSFPVTINVLHDQFLGGRSDGFVTHIMEDGSSIINSTFYGSSDYDQIYFVKLDRNSNVSVFGQTEAPDSTLIHNALYSAPNSGQFISKMTPAMDSLIWSTVFGTGSGGPNISPTSFLVDLCNKVYLSGWGGAVNQLSFLNNNAGNTTGMEVTADAQFSSTDGSDFYIFVLEDDASAISYGSFYGGNQSAEHVDGGTSRFDRKGKIYQSVCAGCGGNDDFPIEPDPGAVSSTNNSSCNNGVFKMDFLLPVVVADFIAPPVACNESDVFFTNTSLEQGSTIYQWDFGDGDTSMQKDPVHQYDSAGVYFITLIASDTASCNLSDTLIRQIIIDSSITYFLSGTSICKGEFVQIGLTPDSTNTYSWSPSAGLNDTTIANPVANPDSTINYILEIDNGICMDTAFQTINVADSVKALLDSPAVGCAPLTVNFSNQFTTDTTAVYFWDFGDSTYSSDETPQHTFQAGSFQVTMIVTDSASCNMSDTAKVNVIVLSDTTRFTDRTLCLGDSMLLGPAFTDTSLTYSWSPSYALNDTSIPNPLCSTDSSIQYMLLMSNGICTDTLLETISVEDFNIKPINDTLLCMGAPLSLNIETDGYGEVFLWSTNIDFTDTVDLAIGDSTVIFTDLDSGNYYLKVESQAGCVETDSINIAYKNSDFTVSPGQSICENDTLHLKAQNNNPADSLDFLWDPESLIIGKRDTSDIQTSPLSSAVFIVTATDSLGCRYTDTVRVNVSGLKQDDVFATSEKDTIIKGLSTFLHGDPPDYYYTWTPGASLDNPSSPNPLASPTETTTYTFKVNDPEITECVGEDSVTVYVVEMICGEPDVFIPRAFTPNDDNVNDKLFVRSRNLTDIYFTVYDRWGEKLFETTDIDTGWDGTYKGMEADPGVFVYHLKGICIDGQELFLKGNVTLIR